MTVAPGPPHQPSGLERAGRNAWYLVGIAAAVILAYLALSQISGLVTPLIVAAVIGALFAPLCRWLGRWMPRHLAALVVLLALLTIGVGTFVIAIRGVIDQAGEIGRQVTEGLRALEVWATDLGIEYTLDDLQAAIPQTAQDLAAIVTSALGTIFTSTATAAIGIFVGLFLLYFILADWDLLVHWTGRNLGVPDDVGAGIIDDATWAMRRYFLALTASNLVSSAIVGVTIWILGLPLAFPIAVVTMVTSYIPFLGAIFSGAFAVVIALGSGGVTEAIIVAVVVLVAQNGVQTIIQTLITQGALKLHPILILGTTIAGGAVFGLLGAALSTPVFASGLKVIARLRAASRESSGRKPPDRQDIPAEGHEPTLVEQLAPTGRVRRKDAMPTKRAADLDDDPATPRQDDDPPMPPDVTSPPRA